MSEDGPLLTKLDALLKKHRGEHESVASATAPPAWLPVLTQVIERGAPPGTAPARAAPSVTPAPLAETGSAPHEEAQLEALVAALAPRLSELIEARFAAELHRQVEQNLAALRGDLDASLREIIREALATRAPHN